MGIKSIEQTVVSKEDGGINEVSVVKTNGTGVILRIQNGHKGGNGDSVTVKSVSQSNSDGGSNVVTFSDGKTVTIKNGNKGKDGDPGSSGVYIGATEPTDPTINVWIDPNGEPSGYEEWVFTLADGSTVTKRVVVLS